MTSQEWGELRQQLLAEVRRVADRLRNLSSARLAGPPGPAGPPGQPSSSGVPGLDSGAQWESRAAAAHAVAGRLADTTAVLEASASGTPSAPRALPVLRDHACGDQVAVAGHDLLAAMDRVGPDTDVGGTSARHLVEAAAAQLIDVRRRL